MEIDRQIETGASEPMDQPGLRPKPGQPVGARRDDQLVYVGIVLDDWRCGRLDQVGNVRVGEPCANGVNGRGCENDVAYLAQAN